MGRSFEQTNASELLMFISSKLRAIYLLDLDGNVFSGLASRNFRSDLLIPLDRYNAKTSSYLVE